MSKYYQTLYKALLTHMKTCYLLYAKPYTQINDDQPATQNCVINEQNFNPSSTSCTAWLEFDLNQKKKKKKKKKKNIFSRHGPL